MRRDFFWTVSSREQGHNVLRCRVVMLLVHIPGEKHQPFSSANRSAAIRSTSDVAVAATGPGGDREAQ